MYNVLAVALRRAGFDAADVLAVLLRGLAPAR
jgi:hypothetical protein